MSAAAMQTGPLTGFRIWRVMPWLELDGRKALRLCAYGTRGTPKEWSPRRPMEAVCSDFRSTHTAPVFKHGCGIWAVLTLEDAERRLAGFLETTNGAGVLGWAIGSVSLWGRVVEHEDGYRAQFAYPGELTVYSRRRLTAERVSALYGVDVEWRSPSRLRTPHDTQPTPTELDAARAKVRQAERDRRAVSERLIQLRRDLAELEKQEPIRPLGEIATDELLIAAVIAGDYVSKRGKEPALLRMPEVCDAVLGIRGERGNLRARSAYRDAVRSVRAAATSAGLLEPYRHDRRRVWGVGPAALARAEQLYDRGNGIGHVAIARWNGEHTVDETVWFGSAALDVQHAPKPGVGGSYRRRRAAEPEPPPLPVLPRTSFEDGELPLALFGAICSDAESRARWAKQSPSYESKPPTNSADASSVAEALLFIRKQEASHSLTAASVAAALRRLAAAGLVERIHKTRYSSRSEWRFTEAGRADLLRAGIPKKLRVSGPWNPAVRRGEPVLSDTAEPLETLALKKMAEEDIVAMEPQWAAQRHEAQAKGRRAYTAWLKKFRAETAELEYERLRFTDDEVLAALEAASRNEPTPQRVLVNRLAPGKPSLAECARISQALARLERRGLAERTGEHRQRLWTAVRAS